MSKFGKSESAEVLWGIHGNSVKFGKRTENQEKEVQFKMRMKYREERVVDPLERTTVH